VRIIVGFAAGGPADITARLIGQWLSERLCQPFVIENRTGAAGNIGTEAVVRAPADGYTVLLCGTPNAINATLYDRVNFNFIRDIAPVASVIRYPYVMVVNPSVPAKSVPEFVAYAKVNPGKINMTSGGTGTGPHIAGELFKMMTGVNLVHVPYRGAGPALADLLAGAGASLLRQRCRIDRIHQGWQAARARGTATRLEALPDVPTMAEFLPGYEATSWTGIGAPKNTPAEIVDKLNREQIFGAK